MRVLYCGVDEALGGIESFVINMYRNIDKSKVQIDFLKITDSIYYEQEFIENGSNIYRIPNRRTNPLGFYYGLFRFFKKHKEYQVVHGHLNSCSCIAALVVAKIYGRKTIAHSHNDFKGNKIVTRILNSINKRVLPFFTDEYIACSNAAGISMFKDKKFVIINNGIDAQNYRYNIQKREEYREKMGISGKFVIGHIGSFKYQKNHEFLIDIFEKVHRKNSNSILMLIGDGELRAEIEKKIIDLNLKNSVILTGVRTDIPELLQAIDIFVLPSRYEGLGIVVIEAQAAGLHCIVADTIPKEAFITNLVEAVMLKDNAETWGEQVLKFSHGYKRKNTYEEIKTRGFDCTTSAKLLEEIYLRMML